MSEKSITVTDQTTGVEIATRDAKAPAGTLARQIQLVSPVAAGMDLVNWGSTGWVSTHDADAIANILPTLEVLWTRMADLRDRSKMVVFPKVQSGFTSATIIPAYFINDVGGPTYIGAGKPVTFAAADIISEYMNAAYPCLPPFSVDNMGADFVALYVKEVTGFIQLQFWAI